MNLEQSIREIVAQELDKRQPKRLTPVAEFCEAHGINRISLWRGEKQGKLKLTRIGRRVFVNPNQFV